MTDNTVLNPGTGGDTIATDDIAGVKYQRIKAGFGGDGVYTDVSAADPLPVDTGGLTDAELRAAAVPVSIAAPVAVTGPLTNAEFVAGLAAEIATPVSTVPDNQLPANPVRVVGQDVWNCSFSNVGASVIAPELTTPIVGTGVGYSQAGGALLITTGTTVNAEFLTRSQVAWRGSLRSRLSIVASQRIANQNLAYILGDLVGEGLLFTINSSVSISVSLTDHGYTSQNVGQFMFIGALGGVGIPGRYAISSVPNADTISFTVAGWPASGSGTLTLFGHSHVKTLINGTTATSALFTTQRKGWADADTTATINTTASPGTVLQVELDGRQCYLSDTIRLSTASPNVTSRASRIESIPDDNLDLYLFIWSYNGTVAPATSTTWTISFTAVEKYANTPVYIQGQRAQGTQNPAPVSVFAGSLQTVSTVSSVASSNTSIPGIITDVASAALTTTTTTATLTPTFGSSYSVSIPVTLVSGTTPTLDVSIQESDDTGTNWFGVYDFPRITATGLYRSPVIPLTGNRVRYVQTVGGTTPSFTRAVNRLQSSINASPIRQLVNRTIVLTTLNSVTTSLDTRDCGNRAQLVVNVGAITTTAPALQMEGSDDNGATWYSIGTPLTAVANSTVQLTINDINSGIMRVRVSTAGVGVTAGYVLLKAHD